MEHYDPQRHHRRSIRLKGYDYSQAGAYFITLCCQDKAHLFGKIENGEMKLSKYGIIAYNEWMKTPEVRPHVELDAFVVMPNHIHGIIIIGEHDEPYGRDVSHTSRITKPSEDNLTESSDVSGECDISSVSDIKGECNSPRRVEFRSPSQTVGAIIRGYKAAVTKQIRNAGFSGIVWQRNYYEHIIRDERAYHNISDYIIHNPANWGKDKFK